MKTYDLYGAKCLSLALARALVEEFIGILLEERDSMYHGGVYYRGGDNSFENFILKYNVDPFDCEPVEQAFPEWSILFYVNATSRSGELMDVLKEERGFSLLRREVF